MGFVGFGVGYLVFKERGRAMGKICPPIYMAREQLGMVVGNAALLGFSKVGGGKQNVWNSGLQGNEQVYGKRCFFRRERWEGNGRRGVGNAGPTDVTRTVQARRVEGFFRSAVLAAYDNRCAISGLAVPGDSVAQFEEGGGLRGLGSGAGWHRGPAAAYAGAV